MSSVGVQNTKLSRKVWGTMVVEAVQLNQRRNNGVMSPMINGGIAGAAVGYAAKYALPLTTEEKNTDEYIKVSNKINEQKLEYNFRVRKFVNELNAKEGKSVAEEQFAKMFAGFKDGDTVGLAKLKKFISNIGKKHPEALDEFKQICKKSRKIADETASQCLKAYNLITKHMRPTGFFVLTGAAVGAVASVASSILRTDIRHCDYSA